MSIESGASLLFGTELGTTGNTARLEGTYFCMDWTTSARAAFGTGVGVVIGEEWGDAWGLVTCPEAPSNSRFDFFDAISVC